MGEVVEGFPVGGEGREGGRRDVGGEGAGGGEGGGRQVSRMRLDRWTIKPEIHRQEGGTRPSTDRLKHSLTLIVIVIVIQTDARSLT